MSIINGKRPKRHRPNIMKQAINEKAKNVQKFEQFPVNTKV